MLFVLLTVMTGVVYPAVVTVAARVLFADEADGSLIRNGGRVYGSRLIGRRFVSPAYFFSRPSESDYSAMPSAGGNQGPTSAELKKNVEKRREYLSKYISGEIPADLLLSSGSGLDPHISPAAATSQIDHVAKARGLPKGQRAELEKLVRQSIETPQFEMFGAPRVNVLILNMETDRMFGIPGGRGK